MKVFRTERERDKRYRRGRALEARVRPQLRDPRSRAAAGSGAASRARAGRRAALDRSGLRRRSAGPRARVRSRSSRSAAASFAAGQRGEPRADVKTGWRVQHRRRQRSKRATRWSRSVRGPTRVTRTLGYDLPLAVKRGYHMHYRPAGEARLNHPVLDHERGYFLAPMRRGIRLTTGAEFALRDAIKTPGAARPRRAHRARPLPARRAPRHRALDGRAPVHARHAAHHRPRAAPRRTCGSRSATRTTASRSRPVTGRLIAELITGATPFVDPTPYRAERFGDLLLEEHVVGGVGHRLRADACPCRTDPSGRRRPGC